MLTTGSSSLSNNDTNRYYPTISSYVKVFQTQHDKSKIVGWLSSQNRDMIIYISNQIKRVLCIPHVYFLLMLFEYLDVDLTELLETEYMHFFEKEG
jgi:hypothetical protein